MASGAFLLFGILSFFELEMEELPEADSTVIAVISELPGFPAKEIESLITIPMENTGYPVYQRYGICQQTGLFKGSSPFRLGSRYVSILNICTGMYRRTLPIPSEGDEKASGYQ